MCMPSYEIEGEFPRPNRLVVQNDHFMSWRTSSEPHPNLYLDGNLTLTVAATLTLAVAPYSKRDHALPNPPDSVSTAAKSVSRPTSSKRGGPRRTIATVHFQTSTATVCSHLRNREALNDPHESRPRAKHQPFEERKGLRTADCGQ